VAISEREQLSLLSVIRIADCPRLPAMSMLSVVQIGALGLALQQVEDAQGRAIAFDPVLHSSSLASSSKTSGLAAGAALGDEKYIPITIARPKSPLSHQKQRFLR